MWTCKDCKTKYSNSIKFCRVCKNKRRIAYNKERYKNKRRDNK